MANQKKCDGKIKIIMADDEEHTMRSFTDMFSGFGYDAIGVENLALCQAQVEGHFKKNKNILILVADLDFGKGVPTIDPTFTLIDKLTDKYENLRVIVRSSFLTRDSQYIKKAIKSGAVGLVGRFQEPKNWKPIIEEIYRKQFGFELSDLKHQLGKISQRTYDINILRRGIDETGFFEATRQYSTELTIKLDDLDKKILQQILNGGTIGKIHQELRDENEIKNSKTPFRYVKNRIYQLSQKAQRLLPATSTGKIKTKISSHRIAKIFKDNGYLD